MARSSTTFTKGHGGARPKGSANRKVKIGTEYAQSFLEDIDHQDAVRLILSNPTHVLFMSVFELVMAYAYGKPTENIHQTSDGSLPSHHLQVAFLDYDKFFALEEAEKEVGNGTGSDPSPL